jgi:sigma-E factor negative regulatory protein RseB
MRPGVEARPGRSTAGLAPGTDPVCLLITTAAVLLGLLVAGLPRAPARPAAPSRASAPGRSPAAGPPAGTALRLLASAASASEAVPYRGVERLAWWGPGGSAATLADVWHRPGQEPAVWTAAQPREWPSGTHRPAQPAPAGRNLVALLELSPRLVSLLGANYVAVMSGRGQVAGRPAVLVTVRRAGGDLAARFWLDQATKLPLRRQMFGAGGRLLGEDAFLSLSVGRAARAAGPEQPALVWRDDLAGGQLAGLRAHGWPLPGPLPGNLTLLDARESRGRARPVVHLAYSDGLSVVSVFVERGSLPRGLAGWSRVAVAGHQVYLDDPDDGSIAWSAHGFVFTVIAQAPARTVSAVVGALPHDTATPPGTLTRMRIGAHRLLAWLGLPR